MSLQTLKDKTQKGWTSIEKQLDLPPHNERQLFKQARNKLTGKEYNCLIRNYERDLRGRME